MTVRDRTTGRERSLTAPYFLDATELGDLLPLAGVEFVTGAEGQDQTGEPHAPPRPRPDNQQAFTCCFAVDYLDGQDHTIDRPAEYDFWQDFVPARQTRLAGPAARPELRRSGHPQVRQPRIRPAGRGQRVVGLPADHRPAELPARRYPGSSGTTLVNWPQNDYWLGPVGRGQSHAGRRRAAHRAGQAAQPLAPVLASDRMSAARRQDRLEGAAAAGPTWSAPTTAWPRPPISANRGASGPSSPSSSSTSAPRPAARYLRLRDVQAEPFADSVGVGSYRIDLHPSTGGDNYIDISSLPFQIPLGALIPVRVENLLPACKNLGTTHITNGCFRLHPVEWAIGEAAGSLAACCS